MSTNLKQNCRLDIKTASLSGGLATTNMHLAPGTQVQLRLQVGLRNVQATALMRDYRAQDMSFEIVDMGLEERAKFRKLLLENMGERGEAQRPRGRRAKSARGGRKRKSGAALEDKFCFPSSKEFASTTTQYFCWIYPRQIRSLTYPYREAPALVTPDRAGSLRVGGAIVREAGKIRGCLCALAGAGHAGAQAQAPRTFPTIPGLRCRDWRTSLAWGP